MIRISMCCLLLSLAQGMQAAEENMEEEEEEEYDDCNFYNDDHYANGECHHEMFPSETLDKVFNSNVKQCCKAHGYMFYDNCEVSHNFSYSLLR